MISLRRLLRLGDQALEGAHIALFVAVVVHGGFGDEGGVGEPRIVEQAAKGLFADGSLPDVLMAIEL